MNDSKIELRITDVNDIACPTCDRVAIGYETNQPERQKFTPVEMWPGGPVWQDPGMFVEYEPDGPAITTLTPCGHHVNRIVWTQEALDQRSSGSEWGGGR